MTSRGPGKGPENGRGPGEPAPSRPLHSERQDEPPAAEGSSVEAPVVDLRPAGVSPRTSRILLAIMAGAVLGGPARYGLGKAFPTAVGTFPATTFAINVSGSLVLALLLVFVLEIWPPTTYVRPFAAVGFCGAYTTFSTWMVDTDRLIARGHYAAATANVAGSLVAGLAATALGFSLGRGVVARNRERAGRRERPGPSGAAAESGAPA